MDYSEELRDKKNIREKEILRLIQKIGVRDVVLRFADLQGKVRESAIEISDIPDDFFSTGIHVKADWVQAKEKNIVVYPDKQAAWLNPFNESPSLVLQCTIPGTGAEVIGMDLDSSPSYSSQLYQTNGPFNYSPRFFMSTPAGTMAQKSFKIPPMSPLKGALRSERISQLSISTPLLEGTAFPVVAGMIGGLGSVDSEELFILNQSENQSVSKSIQKNRQHSTEDCHKVDSPSNEKRQTSKRTGTSCHQCKNARIQEHLASCKNTFQKRSGGDFRKCRKKYCGTCLSKFYHDSVEEANCKDAWFCPSCRHICTCAACSRKVIGDMSKDDPIEENLTTKKNQSAVKSECDAKTSRNSNGFPLLSEDEMMHPDEEIFTDTFQSQ